MKFNKFITILAALPGLFISIIGTISVIILLGNMDNTSFINLEADGVWLYIFKIMIIYTVFVFLNSELFEKIGIIFTKDKKEVVDARS